MDNRWGATFIHPTPWSLRLLLGSKQGTQAKLKVGQAGKKVEEQLQAHGNLYPVTCRYLAEMKSCIGT